ncbi:hypothetical protein UB34_19885 [Photobacterium leiognathi]|uniref:Uncharacterized protein n=1 Tax=Photobacterium leiognathi TaxID=553611 RepID=A0A2T3M5K3_PHOLE|nr:hypothetical protein UB34_19885 [Photobacterium leiognathi]PSV87176.1 hypothetical protein CTM89_18505 [Photobacterium leiognathi]
MQIKLSSHIITDRSFDFYTVSETKLAELLIRASPITAKRSTTKFFITLDYFKYVARKASIRTGYLDEKRTNV